MVAKWGQRKDFELVDNLAEMKVGNEAVQLEYVMVDYLDVYLDLI